MLGHNHRVAQLSGAPYLEREYERQGDQRAEPEPAGVGGDEIHSQDGAE